jgi:predicted nuclease with TOPRIM domain
MTSEDRIADLERKVSELAAFCEAETGKTREVSERAVEIRKENNALRKNNERLTRENSALRARVKLAEDRANAGNTARPGLAAEDCRAPRRRHR